MADYDSSLPVRTEAAGDVDVNISDAVTPSQKLVVEADGSINVNATATDLDIRDLVFATDKVDVTGSDITATVTATDLDIRDLTSATDSVEVLQATHDNLNLNANMQIGDADVSVVNPVPVSMSADFAGDEILDFQTSASIAKDASVNHDYTVTAGKTFIGEEAFISGSGKLKVEVLINGALSFVGFNSTSMPNVRIPMEKIVKAGAAEVIRFTITNRDQQAQDVYSTLLGIEV